MNAPLPDRDAAELARRAIKSAERQTAAAAPLPDDRDELLAFLIVEVDRLGREVEHLAQVHESA